MEERIYYRFRSYQRELLEAKRAGCKRFVSVWHRRAGKDRTWLALTLASMLERVGVYFHVFPSLNQGRRDLWDNIVRDTYNGIERAVPMIGMFPPELVAGKNEAEMQIRLVNGSLYQVMGADNDESIERLRGPNPIGIIFSEYSYMRPQAWETLAPVLAENGGWAAFIYTPKDESHGLSLYKHAVHSPDWFAQLLTIDDTKRDAEGEDGSPVIDPEAVEKFRQEGQREETLQREYYCSWRGFLKGTIYGELMTRARLEGRIGVFPYTLNLPVGVCFDIGTSDATAMAFYQLIGQTIQFIDYHEDTLKGASEYAKVLRNRPYLYGRLSLPWDAKWSAEDFFSSVGFRGVEVVRKTPKWAGIDKVREYFSRFAFDEVRCARLIKCLEMYSREWDDKLGVYRNEPRHDEYSHGADAVRTGAMSGFYPMYFSEGGATVEVETEFDPRLGGEYGFHIR